MPPACVLIMGCRCRCRRWHVLAVTGFLDDALGLAQAARLYIAGLRAAGVPIATTAIAPDGSAGSRRTTIERDPATGPTMSCGHRSSPLSTWPCMNGDHLVRLARTGGGEVLVRRPTIGQWAWETDVLPSCWLPAFGLLRKICRLLTFVADNRAPPPPSLWWRSRWRSMVPI